MGKFSSSSNDRLSGDRSSSSTHRDSGSIHRDRASIHRNGSYSSFPHRSSASIYRNSTSIHRNSTYSSSMDRSTPYTLPSRLTQTDFLSQVPLGPSLPRRPTQPLPPRPSTVSRRHTEVLPSTLPPRPTQPLPPRHFPVSRPENADAVNYLFDLHARLNNLGAPLPPHLHVRLNPKMYDPAVAFDKRQNQADHMSIDAAHQFDMNLPHVTDMMRHMLDAYDTVTVFTPNLVDEGMLIYYPEPYVVHPTTSAAGVSTVGDKFDIKVKVKGRFAIVMRKFSQCIQVVPVYTFNDRGLASKPRRVWKEYVQLSDTAHKEESEEEGEIVEVGKVEKAPNNPIQLGETFCKIMDTSVAHLLPTTVTMSSQMLIAGCITPDALVSLRAMIAKIV